MKQAVQEISNYSNKLHEFDEWWVDAHKEIQKYKKKKKNLQKKCAYHINRFRMVKTYDLEGKNSK